MRSASFAALSTAAALIFGGSAARAESYCVACYQPDAVYRCVIADAPATASPDPRNQIQCIKQIAKAEGHARCSVERFSTAGCNGPERIVSASASPMPLAPQKESGGPQSPQSPSATDAAAPEAAATGPGEPPRTVEEMAKSTVAGTKKGLDDVGGSVKATTEKAGEQIVGAGSAIGNAAKKSWNCLSSFFANC